MPTYATQCAHCSFSGSIRLSFSDYDAIKGGDKELVCNQCDQTCDLVFDPSTVQFVLKDGVSGGWASKSLKENAYRATRRQEMARRERDHVFKPTLQPNYKGVETGNWRDAQEYARTETKKDFGAKAGDAVAKTFEPMVRKATAKTGT